jgi:hypothetical protein
MFWTYHGHIDATGMLAEPSPFFDEHGQRHWISSTGFLPKIVTVPHLMLDAAGRKFEIEFDRCVTDADFITKLSDLRNLKVIQLLVTPICNLGFECVKHINFLF